MKKMFLDVLKCTLLILSLACLSYNAKSQVVINEIYYNPANDISGDANGDGVRSASQDEFVELVNTNQSPVDLFGWELVDADGICFTFPQNTILSPNQALVVFGGGVPKGDFGAALVFTKNLGLNNADNFVIIRNKELQNIDSVHYKTNDAVGKSFTRSPDITGDFVAHNKIGDGKMLFSPGLNVHQQLFSEVITTAETDAVRLQMHFYPNPVKEHLYYESGDEIESVQLVSIFGDSKSLDFSTTQINLPEGLEPGMYFLIVFTKSKRFTSKVTLL